MRRSAYLWALLLGSVVLIIVWSMRLRRPGHDYYVLVGHPLLLVQCVWAAWWLLRRKPLIVAERVVFVVNGFAILVQMLLAVKTDERQLLGLTSPAYWMLVAFSILSYLIFTSRQALQVSGAFYALSVLLPWSALLLHGESLRAYGELARVQLTCGVVLGLLSVLAWYRQRFTVERGQRLSLELLANTDPMTQLPNRRSLYPRIEGLLADARAGAGGCLILLDVDHFKRVNDTYGHNTGDMVLIRLAGLLQASLRGSDTAGRWGGEEFLITLPGLTAAGGAQVAERLRQQLAGQLALPGGSVTASFGVSACTAGDELESCVARADWARYRAQATGRNRVVLLEPGAPGDAAGDVVEGRAVAALD